MPRRGSLLCNLEIDCNVVRRDAAYGRLLCVVACAALCALPSFAANLEITSDTSLAADATADALVVSPGATLDLNGHSLTVGDIRPGAGGMIAGRYRLYEYVLATGDQYIMTDYIPAATDRVQAKVRYTNNNGTYQFLFCTRLGGKQSFTCLRDKNNTSMRLDHGAASVSAASAVAQNTDYIVTMNGEAGAYSILTTAGTGKSGSWTRTENYVQSPGPFVLLSGGSYEANGSFTENTSYRCKCRLYWFRVFDANGTIKCYIVPAKDTTTDVVGLYDLVTGKFHAPSAGTLTAEGTYQDMGGCVVNTSATEATLTVDVAQGVAVTNSAVEIAGNVKLVKSGGGTFVASKYHQSYLGGTEVGGGTLQCSEHGNHHPFGADHENLVRNGDFEATDLTSDYTFANDAAWTNCMHWTCNPNNGIVGLTKSTVSTWVPKDMDIGTYAMVMRTHANGDAAYAEQMLYITSPGTYRLRFAYITCNGDKDRRGATFYARLIKGSVTNTICTLSTSDLSKRFYSGTVNVSEPGAWTLQFYQPAGTKVLSTNFDDVEFKRVNVERNLLVNGSFDQGTVTQNSGKYSYANQGGFNNPGWNCDGANMGLTTANNTWVQSGVDVGTYAAYLRTAAGSGDAWLAQTVQVATPGIYRLSFAYSVCYNTGRRGEPVEVRIIHNGVTNLVGKVTAPANFGKLYFSTFVNMFESGAWTLQFWQKGTHLTGSAVRSTNIDDVMLELTQGMTVKTGGTLDMNGTALHHDMPFMMAGGVLVNSGYRVAHNGNPTIGRMLLTADSSFVLAHAYGFYVKENGTYRETFLDLGGHTLDVQLVGDHTYIANCTMTNGTLRVSASDNSSYLAFIDGNSRAVDVDLEISCGLRPYSDAGVFRDLTLAANVTGDSAVSQTLEVWRRFKCLTASYCNVKLLDGATFDLSENTSPLSFTSAVSGKALTLDDGGAYVVHTGDRAIAAGDKLLAWSDRPALDLPWTFTLVCDGETPEERGLALSVRNDGLYVKDATTPAYARLSTEGEEPEWKFYTTNGTEVVGWSGGVTADMQVRFFSNAEFAAINALATPVTPSEFLLAGTFVLEEGEGVVDMTGGLAFGVLPGVTIDVKGRRLKLPNSVVGGTRAFTVTSSVDGGELLVDVASGTVDNTAMSLAGALKLVKQGAGTLAATKTGQTNTGGVEILEGMVRGAAASAPFGAAGSEVVVSTNGTQIGVMEMNGRADIYAAYTFVMNGGRVQNTASDIGSDRPQLKTMRLTADSHITATHNMGLTAATEEEVSLDLGGHALHVNVGNRKYFFLRMKEIKNGTIDVLSGGWTRFGIEGTFHEGDSHIVATNVDVIIRSALEVFAPVDVRGYEAQYYSNYDVGAYRFNVFGRFKPSAHNCFHACELQDGSVLDLTSRTNACPVASAFTTAIADGGPSLKFASGANVTVNLAGRTDLRALRKSADPRIVAWTAGTAPDASVKFKLDDSTRMRYALRRDESGLSLIAGGLMVIVK